MNQNLNYILTFVAALSLSTLSFGQITWDQQTADTARGFETNLEISTQNNVTFEKAGFYRWVRMYDSSCSALTMGIVDKVSCGLETTDSMDFYVEANETFTMTCYFYPNQTMIH